VCVPPDFREWIEGLGIAVTPIGPEVRSFAAARPAGTRPTPLTLERRQQLADASVATQFETLFEVAQGCDIIVAATALQIAARSIAEKLGIPYVFAAYTPTVLPSTYHAPPELPPLPGQAHPLTTDNLELWARDAARFNDLFGRGLNAHRAKLGLAPVGDVRGYMLTDRPWLAADPTLGPWPDREDNGVFQTGAWILADERSLPRELETFLESGEPPIYFGFGSTRALPETGQMMLEAARALGRRAIVSRGWFDESLAGNAADCLSIGEVNILALFPRVAAVVHHGGAGTTTAAALAGTPQAVLSHHYDQHYWARQVERLGIGAAHAPGTQITESLTRGLACSLEPGVAARARSVAKMIRRDGVEVAARELERTSLRPTSGSDS
jgi:vancomycin aglycone glucosyltransferase